MNQAGIITGRLRILTDAGLHFRLGRLLFLTLMVTIAFEAVTAPKEACLIGAAFFLTCALVLAGGGKFRPTVLLWPWLLYTMAAALSLASAVDPAYSLREFRAEVLKGLLAYYTAVHLVQDQEHGRQAWWALLWGSAIMALAGFGFFFYHGGNLWGHQVRASSLHHRFAEFSMYLVMVWPYILFGRRGLGQGRRPWLFWGLLALNAGAVFITYSRAAWLAIVLQLGLYRLLIGRHRVRSSLIAVGVCLLLVLLLPLLPGSSHGERWSRLLRQPNEVGGTLGDLFDLWEHSLREIGAHPLVGIGVGRLSFSKAFPDFRRNHHPLLWHAHNSFINAALQMGLQGLAALVLLLAVMLWRLWPRSPPSRGSLSQNFMAATVVMVLGFCVRNLSDDLFIDDAKVLFWLLVGLAMGLSQLPGESAHKPTASPLGAGPGKGSR